jgi:hypothetical protein
MSEEKKARLDIIDATIGFDETVIFDVLALLFGPGGGLKKREAEGFLVLTSRRLIFATSRHSIMVDLSMKDIERPITLTYRLAMARLIVQTKGGGTNTFVVNKSAAQGIASTVNKAAAA